MCSGAFHGPSYGLDAELKNKMDSKYDTGMDAEVRCVHEPHHLGGRMCVCHVHHHVRVACAWKDLTRRVAVAAFRVSFHFTF